MNDFHPDIDHARQFLALLDSDPASFTFQVIPERDGCKTKPMISHGSIDDLADRLFEANKAGAGVFFMVNAGDKKGRCAENVQRVRAHFVDLDTPGVDPLFTAEIPPHIVVESSANKWHAYWLAEAGASLDEFSALQRSLAQRFCGDPTVNDIARLMRLPGFYHQKKNGEPFMTRMHDGMGG
ncbi:MAG: hypothetical protein KGL91_06515 [Xanthomonadaceae bacterium]|nr:hypothetical protein [Xanthomonadaceae bacterium]